MRTITVKYQNECCLECGKTLAVGELATREKKDRIFCPECKPINNCPVKDRIKYPERHSEAEIEALLWHQLQQKGIDARLQVTAYSSKSGGNNNKLDLVVFKNKAAICIVECKSWSDSYYRVYPYRRNNSKQIVKYRETYNLPVLLCGRMDDIPKTIEDVLLM